MNKSRTIISVFQIALGCLILILYVSETGARERCELVPETWKPALEQVSGYLEESAKADARASQQTLNQNSQNLSDIRDAQLFIVYIQLMQTLDTQEQARLFAEQKHWLGQRAEYAEAAVISRGGSLAPLEYNSAFKKITEERLTELKKRLQQ